METLVIPLCSHQCHGGQGEKRIVRCILPLPVDWKQNMMFPFHSFVEECTYGGMVCLEDSSLGLWTSKGSQTGLCILLPGCWALSLQRSTQEMGQELNGEILCSTSLKDKKVPHTKFPQSGEWNKCSCPRGKNDTPKINQSRKSSRHLIVKFINHNYRQEVLRVARF